MKEITKNIYSFRELVELNKEGKVGSNALERVRQSLREWNADNSGINDSIWENQWKPVVEALGFHKPKLSWSGFWSQGDGASFTADSCDIDKLVKWFTESVTADQSYDEKNLLPWAAYRLQQHTDSRFKEVVSDIGMAIVRSAFTNYCHERTCRVEVSNCGDNCCEVIANDFVSAVENLRLEICKAVYEDLEKEYEYLISDEALIQLDESNEYHWDIRGRQE